MDDKKGPQKASDHDRLAEELRKAEADLRANRLPARDPAPKFTSTKKKTD